MKKIWLMFLFLTAFLAANSFAADSQNLSIQNVTLEPGDVISFLGGGGSEIIAADTYGHTGMYLGVDSVTGEKVFLDFTTTKEGPFRGRISNLDKFLSDNASHKEFDVYRLNENSSVDQQKLIDKAKEIARDKTFGALIDCANAASRTLSAATGMEILAIRPDMYAESEQFKSASPVRINIETAIGELNGSPDSGAVNGTWSGNASADDGTGFNISLHIQNVTSGTSTLDWNSGHCSGSLSGGYQGDHTYVYQVRYSEGRRTRLDEAGCIDGTVRLTLGSDGIANYSWSGTDVDGSPQSASTVLTKQP